MKLYSKSTYLSNYKEIQLEEIQSIVFDILKYFAFFCKKNNIKYFLSNGTLLGAIKYQSFIPWDDDIDVLIPRRDYERLIQSFIDTDQYKLFSEERVPNYRFPFAKLCDMTTLKKEGALDNGVELGLDIDIFPLDVWPDNKSEAIEIASKCRKYISRITLAKLPFSKGKSLIRTLVKWSILFVVKSVGCRRYIQKIHKIAVQNKDKEQGVYMGCIVWPIYGEREIIPAEVFSDSVEVEFEGDKFFAPIGYDIYLRRLYGDYWQDPPKENQKTHHDFKAYRL